MTTPKPRKPRFAFTIDKDIRLLKSALCVNPWQTGQEKWHDVVRTMEMEYDTVLTTRTVSGRINLLQESFKKQQLKSKTGTEEQETERGRLLAEIETICAEEDASKEINITSNVETELLEDADDDVVATDRDEQNQLSDEPDQMQESSSPIETNATDSAKRKSRAAFPKSAKKVRIAERDTANLERAKYLDQADDPGNRTSKSRLSIEDQMIIKKQEHEIEMDIQRLALDKERLEVDKRRELRIEEETRRRDEIHMSQMLLQQSMLALINKVLYNGNM